MSNEIQPLRHPSIGDPRAKGYYNPNLALKYEAVLRNNINGIQEVKMYFDDEYASSVLNEMLHEIYTVLGE